MKKKISANPFIGTKGEDGMFQYKEGRFTIRYAITYPKTPNEKIIPQWISVKIKLAFRKNILEKIKEEIVDFWHYQKWLILFHPSTIAVLIFIAIFVYFGAIEFQPHKGYLIRWVASRAIGVSPDAIEYEGGGWIRVHGTRVAINKEIEPFNYDVNFFRWLVFNDAGSVTRYRGKEYGAVTQPVGYNAAGEVYIKKEGKLKKGEIKEGAIKWDEPEVVSIREGKPIRGHAIETTTNKVELRDK
ncbi:MAG: hypothetical protein AMJ78_08905 [Omnitrophica WOR_2 bacterium SM23_29]|nr:MAG: hypothetical protein AMJ78_08905 [Omnitrophica WOR_2 bacterium SM23_29]